MKFEAALYRTALSKLHIQWQEGQRVLFFREQQCERKDTLSPDASTIDLSQWSRLLCTEGVRPV